MRPKKTRKPFGLYRKNTQTGLVWYVRFWDETTQKYSVTRSTGIPVEGKKQRRYEAEQAARDMLLGICFTPPALEKAEKSFTQYVADFWKDDSPYVRECALVKKKPLSKGYIQIHHDDVRRHLEPFPGFQSVTLQTITAGHIRDWMTWASEQGLKGGRINKVMQAMSVAVHYAVDREELDRDPFKNIHEAPDTRKEKGVLTSAEILMIIRAPVNDPRIRLAVLLGARCGLRLGEVRGLRWGDIGDGIINVCHNWVDGEGLKAPKQGSTGTVPISESVQTAIDVARKLTINPEPESFVMESLKCPGQPSCKTYFENGLEKELIAIGIPGEWRPVLHQGKKLTVEEKAPPEGYITEQKRRNLTFHGLRHTFVTLGRLAGLTDLEIQTLARHKSGAMMERYSHASQVLDFSAMREKLEKAVGE
jgi:integrase